MKSMTGFGRASGEVLGARCVIEVRSVNHRFLDLKLRLPPRWQDATVEQLLAQQVRRRIERGSLSLTVQDEGQVGRSGGIRVDDALARSYGVALRGLVDELQLTPSPTLDAQLLALVAAQPGVLQTGEALTDPEQVAQALAPLLERALVALCEVRAREGQALAQDLLQRVALLHQHRERVAALAAVAPEELRRRLTDRLGKLLVGPSEVDPQRVAQEVAILADRTDISEELTRLYAHLVEFARLCEAGAPAGRRLDFLTQELNREVNTIGAKAQSAEVAARVVAMKAEVERLREQIQNVE